MDFIRDMVNAHIEKILPRINRDLRDEIFDSGLDPYDEVLKDKVGKGGASIRYRIVDMTGMGSIDMSDLVVVHLEPDPEDPTKLRGDVTVRAALAVNPQARVRVTIKEFFIGAKTKGKLRISNMVLSGRGTFTATLDGERVLVDTLHIGRLKVDYTNLNMTFAESGIYKKMLKPVKKSVLAGFKDDVRSKLSRRMTKIFNAQLVRLCPLEVDLDEEPEELDQYGEPIGRDDAAPVGPPADADEAADVAE